MKSNPSKKLDEYYKKATKLQHAQEYDQAISYFDKIIEINPLYYTGLTGKARAFYYLGKFNDALIWIDKALEAGIHLIKLKQQPYDNPITLAQKSHILAKLERFDEAFSCINKALTINPKCVHVQQAKKFVIKEFEKSNGGTR